ncbi:MAG: P63C domain-containing protein [Candidatus Binataceae bacterium]
MSKIGSSEHGRALAAIGASKGGKARVASMTAQQRSNLARQAAVARWMKEGKEPPVFAEYGSPDRPLRIGPIEIPCYVLMDGRRVLSQRGLQGGIGLSEAGGRRGARRLTVLMASLAEKGLNTGDLIARSTSPIRFIPPHGGNPADGYEATILPDICAVIIEAGRRGLLQKQQARLAEQCALLQHGFATVGIIALVDEATGYQDFRARDALAKIIERFVAKELQPYVRTFPAEFYKQIFRLYGWDYHENCGKPSVLGHITNNLVYKRLAPGVLEELRRKIPRDDKGRLKKKLFQGLTPTYGHPKVRELLAGETMLAKYSPNLETFMERVDLEYPQYGQTMKLPFPEKLEALADEATRE